MGPPKFGPGSSFDPACDQCRLKKIRCGREQPKCLTCRRARVACTFSDRGKRLSQTNIIINNLEELKARLHHIEQSVSQLKAGSRLSRSGTPAQDQLVPKNFVSSNHEMDGMSIDSCADPSPQDSNNFMDGEPHEFSSLASLLRDIALALESNLDSKESSRMDDDLDKNVQECLAILEDISKSLLADDSWDLSGESLPPKLPPKGLLDASLESYFRQVNPALPVFDEDSFYDNINKNYEAGSEQANRAWIMCFNNVILQTLNAKTASSFTKKPQRQASSPLSADTETTILTPFLVNLRRAVGRLDYFHKPSLVSVQALMSMCLVAQDNFQYRLASFLLQQACFVAKSIRLHQQNAMSADYSSAEKSQRLRVFWTLYIIDKSITSMIGQSCYMPFFDCNVGLPDKIDLADTCLKGLLPRIELALIQEDAYKRLRSSQPGQVGTERRSSILHLSKKLTDWALKYCDLFEETPIDGSSSPLALTDLQANTALTYHFHITRLMVHRPSKDPSDKKQCREDAVACIQLLQRLSGDPSSEDGSVMLRQTIRDHPLVPFFILFHHAVQSPQSELSAQDLRLMVLVTDILQRVPGFTRSRAYVTYLSSCCRAVAALIHKPAHVNPIAPAESLKPDTPSTDDPFAVFNDFPFDKDVTTGRKNSASNGSNKNSKSDDGDSCSDKNPDSDSLSDTLARGQNWPASFPPTDPLSLTSSQPESFSAPSWTSSFDFASIASSGNLNNSIYHTNSELHPPWPSASPAPAQQYQQQLQQPQQDSQGGWAQQQQPQQLQRQLWQTGRQPQQQWPQEMDMGFLMPEAGVSSWGESWLN